MQILKNFSIHLFLLVCLLNGGGNPSVVFAESRSTIKILIDRVNFKGVKALSPQLIDAVVEIGSGDPVDHGKIIQSEKNLVELYKNHGFPKIKITTRLLQKKSSGGTLSTGTENILEFGIEEGLPVKVSSVAISFIGEDQSIERKTKKDFEFWAYLRKKVGQQIDINTGDIFDSEKILQSITAIQEYFIDQEYMGSGVQEVRQIPSTNPSSSSASASDSQDGSEWIQLEFRIQVGEKVTFGFRGNNYLSWSKLESLVDEQRSLGLGKKYLSGVQHRIEQEYRSNGYNKVNISFLTFDNPSTLSRKVTFVIEEGMPVAINSIRFDGQSNITSAKLLEQFYSKATPAIRNGIYVEKDVQKAADSLIDSLKDNGYLFARLIGVHALEAPPAKTPEKTIRVNIVVYLHEGTQTLVNSIKISGNHAASAEEIQKIFGIQEHQPLNLSKLSDSFEYLKGFYRNLGYLSFQIINEHTAEGSDRIVEYTEDNKKANLLFKLQEGPQFTISRIQVDGLVHTKKEIAERELLLTPGTVLSEANIKESEWKLKRLGIFSTASIRYFDDPTSNHQKVVVVKLQEADRGLLAFGLGVSNVLGIQGTIQYSSSNLWGRNHTAFAELKANRRLFPYIVSYKFLEAQANLGYTWPWFGMKQLFFRPQLTAGRTQYQYFNSDQFSGSTTWEKLLVSKPNLLASLTYSFDLVNQFGATFVNGSPDQENNGLMRIGTITPRISLDLRDSPTAPTAGFYGTSGFDLALPVFGSGAEKGAIGFYRISLKTDYFIPLFKKLVWQFKFGTGYEQALVRQRPEDSSFSTIPLIRQFSIGGASTLRGFQENELTIKTLYSLPVQQSASYVNYRTQLDIPLGGSLWGDIFFDVANLLIDHYSFVKDLFYSTGLGVRFKSPVGAINFEFGFKLNNPLPQNSGINFHLSVGMI